MRTARRWEREFGLPIQRLGPGGASVFCFPDDLDSWLRRTDARATPRVRPVWVLVDRLASSPRRKITLDETRFRVLFARSCSEALSIAERMAVEGFVVIFDLGDDDTLQLSTAIRTAHPTKPVIVLAGSNPGEPFTSAAIALTEFPPGKAGRRLDLSVVLTTGAVALP